MLTAVGNASRHPKIVIIWPCFGCLFSHGIRIHSVYGWLV